MSERRVVRHPPVLKPQLDGSSLELLSFEYIDARFTEYARDFTMKNG